MRLLIDLDDETLIKLRKKAYDMEMKRKNLIEKIIKESL